MPVSTPMVVPGAVHAAPTAFGTGGTRQIGNTAPVPRRSVRFQHDTAAAFMDTGPWYSPPRLPPSSFATGPMTPFTQPGTVPPMLTPSTQLGAVPHMPPPYTQSVILPPIFNDMMAIVRENRFMHLAALEQQRELTRYMNSLNEWLGHDVEDRQAELRGVAARIDQLRDDVNRLGLTGMTGMTRESIPPPKPGVEPGSFMVSGGPGAPVAPSSPAASRNSFRPTSIFSRARQLFSSGTVPQLPQVSISQSTQQDSTGIISPVPIHGYGMPTPIESPAVSSPPLPDGGAPFISPDLGSVRGSVAIPPEQVNQPAVSASDDEMHTPLEPSNSTMAPIETPRSPPVAVSDPQSPPRQPSPNMLAHIPPRPPPNQLGITPGPPRGRSPAPLPIRSPGQPTLILPPQPDILFSATSSTSTKPVHDEHPDESGLVPSIAEPPGFVGMIVSSPSQPPPPQLPPTFSYSTPPTSTSVAVASSSGRLSSHNSVRATMGESSVVVPPASIFTQPYELSSSETDEDEAVASSIASSNDTLSTPPPSRKQARPRKSRRLTYDEAPIPPGLAYPLSPLMHANTLASPGASASATSADQGHHVPPGMTPALRNRNLTTN